MRRELGRIGGRELVEGSRLLRASSDLRQSCEFMFATANPLVRDVIVKYCR
jgi:hypothetical protein